MQIFKEFAKLVVSISPRPFLFCNKFTFANVKDFLLSKKDSYTPFLPVVLKPQKQTVKMGFVNVSIYILIEELLNYIESIK